MHSDAAIVIDESKSAKEIHEVADAGARGAARSSNGIDAWRVDSQPTLITNPTAYPEEIWGIEDPRITYVPELDQYAVAYTSFARGGPGVSLALTKDFRSFERFGVVMSPEDKDATLCRGCTTRDYPAIELALNQHEIR